MDNEKETVLVELLIRIEGSAVENRLTTFELPILDRLVTHDDVDGSYQVQFSTKELIRAIKKAVGRLT